MGNGIEWTSHCALETVWAALYSLRFSLKINMVTVGLPVCLCVDFFLLLFFSSFVRLILMIYWHWHTKVFLSFRKRRTIPNECCFGNNNKSESFLLGQSGCTFNAFYSQAVNSVNRNTRYFHITKTKISICTVASVFRCIFYRRKNGSGATAREKKRRKKNKRRHKWANTRPVSCVLWAWASNGNGQRT